jgi:hypothetical protein
LSWTQNNASGIFRPARDDSGDGRTSFSGGYIEFLRGTTAGAQIRNRANDPFIKGAQIFIFADGRNGSIGYDVSVNIEDAVGYFWLVWGPKHGMAEGWWAVSADFFSPTGLQSHSNIAINRTPARERSFGVGDWVGSSVTRPDGISNTEFARILSHAANGFSVGQTATFRFAGRLVAYDCPDTTVVNQFSTGNVSNLSAWGWTLPFQV